jgi:hypothetical protein
MKKKWILIAFFAPIAVALFIWIGGELVMHLWNWLAPTLFGWRLVTFWQALGLLAICRILFGAWGGSGGKRHSGPMREGFKERAAEKMGERMRQRWERMTPEEREKFRQGLRGCWDSFGGSPESKTST